MGGGGSVGAFRFYSPPVLHWAAPQDGAMGGGRGGKDAGGNLRLHTQKNKEKVEVGGDGGGVCPRLISFSILQSSAIFDTCAVTCARNPSENNRRI